MTVLPSHEGSAAVSSTGSDNNRYRPVSHLKVMTTPPGYLMLPPLTMGPEERTPSVGRSSAPLRWPTAVPFELAQYTPVASSLHRFLCLQAVPIQAVALAIVVNSS